MKPHLLLNNPRGEQRSFDASRGFETPTEQSTTLPQAFRVQKNKLNGSLTSLKRKMRERVQKRTLTVPEHIDYVRMDFFVIFNNNDPVFKTKTRFKNEFGLVPVGYVNFNQTVYFAITDERKFRAFLQLLENFINSQDNVSPSRTPYAITTLLYDFEFLSSDSILIGRPEGDVILSLVKKDESISNSFDLIYTNLIDHLSALSNDETRIEIATDGISTIEIKNITRIQVRNIADNFDIIYKIQSLRIPTIRPNEYNVPELTWNLQLRPPAKNVIIGVLDNGVRPIAPLRGVLLSSNLDITSKRPNPLQATHPHGTIVASLAAMGMSFFDTTRMDFTSDAYILPIKILNFNEGHFNIYEIQSIIQSAVRRGVKIFNLSVTGPSKMYNESITEYAYLLDRLAYENDILIFIAAGNLEGENIDAMQQEIAEGRHLDFHTYPFHFYNPQKESDSHVCEAINLCMPGESFNNITVGAIADNLIANTRTDLTPFKELPAYYTRKHYIDYNKEINGSEFSRSQMNFNISKPDIVMPGGDLLGETSAMQVLGFGDNGDFYIKHAGTSLATPLASNLAAKIVGLYPSLNMQSVKALIINSASKLLGAEFLDELVLEIKNTISRQKFHKGFARLTTTEKKIINEKINGDDLYHRLVGYGMPDISKALYSNSKSVSIVIQDTVAINSYKVINLNIPKYLLDYSKKAFILKLKATLCFKFHPVWNNHLGYNPLHISFNFIKSLEVNDPVKTAEIISDRNHRFFSRSTRGITDPKKITKAKNEALGIKKNITSWSEDFYPPSSKPFSNTQQLELNITTEELEKVRNQISIVIRCTFKKDLERETVERLQNSAHPFSIAINISEKENNELTEFDLYDELSAENTLSSLADVILEAEEDLEAEI